MPLVVNITGNQSAIVNLATLPCLAFTLSKSLPPQKADWQQRMTRHWRKNAVTYVVMGITRDANLMTHEPDGGWYYQQIDLGFNYRMTELQAALG